VSAAIERAVAALNGKAGDPVTFDGLHDLLEAQAFRLAYWRVAQDEINYRRFFDINDLAALRQENEAVFEETHKLVISLVKEGAVEALRIDHPDGLFDPKEYFRRLQQACGSRCTWWSRRSWRPSRTFPRNGRCTAPPATASRTW
jgi:(1->4)-alpha-D-glucan 1-alpha-D-glucosylmutase